MFLTALIWICAAVAVVLGAPPPLVEAIQECTDEQLPLVQAAVLEVLDMIATASQAAANLNPDGQFQDQRVERLMLTLFDNKGSAATQTAIRDALNGFQKIGENEKIVIYCNSNHLHGVRNPLVVGRQCAVTQCKEDDEGQPCPDTCEAVPITVIFDELANDIPFYVPVPPNTPDSFQCTANLRGFRFPDGDGFDQVIICNQYGDPVKPGAVAGRSLNPYRNTQQPIVPLENYYLLPGVILHELTHTKAFQVNGQVAALANADTWALFIMETHLKLCGSRLWWKRRYVRPLNPYVLSDSQDVSSAGILNFTKTLSPQQSYEPVPADGDES
ncbi:hypothetical protein B7463_g11254, partial [Scytalidium lignicola]